MAASFDGKEQSLSSVSVSKEARARQGFCLQEDTSSGHEYVPYSLSPRETEAEDCLEFEASFGYIVSSRTASAMT